MYAIIEAGGRQWRVAPGTQLDINRIAAEVGAKHIVERVLLAADGTAVQVGRPYLPGGRVVCEVVSHGRGPKVIAYHFRRRENWRKTVGHRQDLTRLLVKDIQLAGAPAAVSEAPPARLSSEPGRAARATGGPGKPRAKRSASKAKES